MFDKSESLRRISESGVVAIIRAESSSQALKLAEAVRAGGIDVIEITLTVPDALDVVRELSRTYPAGEVLIGAGTVLDPETARAAILAGAQFIVSPHLDARIVEMSNRYGRLCMPGAMTVREIVEALACGADVIKVFPGSVLGPGFVRAVREPLPQARLLPTGGVNLDNVQEWIRAGCIAVGVGGALTGGAKTGDYELVAEMAARFVREVKQARSRA